MVTTEMKLIIFTVFFTLEFKTYKCYRNDFRFSLLRHGDLDHLYFKSDALGIKLGSRNLQEASDFFFVGPCDKTVSCKDEKKIVSGITTFYKLGISLLKQRKIVSGITNFLYN